MDYKKIFRKQSTRHKILKLLSFLPDKLMIGLQYKIKLGFWPKIRHPERYTEKLQSYKLFYRNPVLFKVVDKLAVREYVREKGLDNILPELYGVYRRAEDIDFDSLPERFVMKTNDGSGGHNVLICKDKSSLDKPKAVKELNSWLNMKDLNPGREWAYSGISDSVIIVEEYLENKKSPEAGIEDYKFMCFNGKPAVIVYDGDRFIGHKRNFYDLEWNNLNIGSDCPPMDRQVPKPENLDRLLEVAGILSKDFPHVRVDLYSVEGKVYFGELTFYPWSGYVKYDPDEFDFKLGKMFDVSSFMKKS